MCVCRFEEREGVAGDNGVEGRVRGVTGYDWTPTGPTYDGRIAGPLPKGIIKQKCEGSTLDTANIGQNRTHGFISNDTVSASLPSHHLSRSLSVLISVFFCVFFCYLCIRAFAEVGGPVAQT